jgi:hypothetical protein
VSLYEAYRQRAAAGMYENPQLSPAEAKSLFAEWAEK